MVFVDELDIHLLPRVGAAWRPKGTQEEIMTPGKNEQHYLAGVLNLTTGAILHCLGPRKTNALFRGLLDQTYPTLQVTRIYVVVDNYCIHKAKAVRQLSAQVLTKLSNQGGHLTASSGHSFLVPAFDGFMKRAVFRLFSAVAKSRVLSAFSTGQKV